MVEIVSESIDPRVLRTRKLLQDALRGLVHESKFSIITVQQVAERATVNRATFYAHFRDKHELLVSFLKADLESQLSRALPENAPFNPDTLTQAVVAVCEFVGGVSGGCPEAAREFDNLFGSAVLEGLYVYIRRWIERDPILGHEAHSDDTVATVLSWSIFGTAFRWSRGNRKRPAIEVATKVVAILLPQRSTADEA